MGFEVSGFGSRVSGFGSRVSGFWFRVWGFGSRVSGPGFLVSGLGSRVSGFGWRGQHILAPNLRIDESDLDPLQLPDRGIHREILLHNLRNNLNDFKAFQ